MKVLVITSSTANQLGKPSPAERLYTDKQHVRLMKGVIHARGLGDRVDVIIVSPRYGLVHGQRTIEPYDTLMNKQTQSFWISHGIQDQLADLLQGYDYNVGLILLSHKYECNTDFRYLDYVAPTVRLTGGKAWSCRQNYIDLKCGRPEAKLFSTSTSVLKGEMAGRILVKGLHHDPHALLDLFYSLKPLL